MRQLGSKRVFAVAAIVLSLALVVATVPILAASTGNLLGYPVFKGWTTAGKPLSGGKLYTYKPGSSTTLKYVYQDKRLTTPHPDPVVLDTNGEAKIYLNGNYRLVLKTSAGVQLWSIDYEQGLNGIDGNTTLYPELQGALGDGNTDDSGAYTATLALCPSNRCQVVHTGTYRFSSNVTIPAGVSLDFLPGGMLSPDSGKTVTISSPANVIARDNQQVFTGLGQPTFTNPAGIYSAWFGPDNTGATDSYTRMTVAITSAPATSTVHINPGLYLMQTGLSITKGINITGNCSAINADGTYGSTLKAGASLTGTMLLWNPASPYTGQNEISCIGLDGDNIAADGLKIRNASQLKVKDVTAYDFTARGFWVDGYTDGGLVNYAYQLGITFDNCHASGNTNGFSVERKGTGVWGTVIFNNCKANSNYTGLFVKGDNETDPAITTPSPNDYYYEGYGTTVAWNGGTLEGKSSVAWDVLVRGKDGANVTIRDAYLETYSSNPKHYWLSGNSFASVSGGAPSPIYWYSRFDDNSTLCMESSGNGVGWWGNLYGGVSGHGFLTNRMCIGGKISDKTSYGSPWVPTDLALGGNTLSYKGMRSTDNYGTEYVQVEDNGTGYDGTEGSGSAILNNASRWAPTNGRIIIPVTYTDLNRGNYVPFFAEADFIMTDMDFIVEDTFVSGDSGSYCNAAHGYLEIGTTNHTGMFITKTQGSVTNLVSLNTISAQDNDNATTNALGNTYTSTSTSTSALEDDNLTDGNLTIYTTTTTTTAGKHKLFYMPGYASSVMSTSNWDTNTTYRQSYVRINSCPSTASLAGGYTTGKWTGGKGWLLIRGYSTEFNRYGQ